MSQNEPAQKGRWWASIVTFVVVALASGLTVAGPGLTWDEPAYRNSQVRLEEWMREVRQAPSLAEVGRLFDADAIDFYFEYNRPGPNFHPPMAGYLNLLSLGFFGGSLDDLCARRLASSLELALTAACICFVTARRLGVMAGLFAGLSLAAMPRVFGDAHIMGTDVPLMMFWTFAGLAFLPALNDRRWQWVLALLLAALFLVKFTGLVILLPIGLAWLFVATVRGKSQHVSRWLVWSLALIAPWIPLAVMILLGARDDLTPGLVTDLVIAGRTHSHLLAGLLLAPAMVLIVHGLFRRPVDWPIAWELPWAILAITPVAAIALNPTWWHDPVLGLARFFDLNLRRQGFLPDISIFYLGRQYIYSLPWHNAWVLIGVTLPWGLLFLGVAGIFRSIWLARREPWSAYFVLQALTLPVLRMFPVPAHDGVRLFLPTFPFWSLLAAGAAHAWARGKPGRWVALWLVGPILGGVEIARYHPVELSYYNVGPIRARDLGFELTYWYDAVTPTVLDDLNERLPRGAAIAFPSPQINPEIFYEHQAQGRLRPDIELDVSKATGLPYMLLLTHSAKSTPFSRLLFGVEPWYQTSAHGVRLFSVIDPNGVALAWGLHALTVDNGPTGEAPATLASGTREREKLDERIFSMEGASIETAVRLLMEKGDGAIAEAQREAPEVRELLERWSKGSTAAQLRLAQSVDPQAPASAARILAQRGADVRTLLEAEGYLSTERFGGFLRP